MISCIIYYLNPADHGFVNKHVFFSLMQDFLPQFAEVYAIKLLPFHIVNIVFWGLIFFFREKNDNFKQNVRFLSCTLINNLCFLFYYFVVSYIILCFVDVEISDFYYGLKAYIPYIAILLFYNFMLTGYFLENCTNKEKFNRFFIKIIPVFFILLLNFQGLTNYFQTLNSHKINNIKEKELIYRIEKSVIQQAGQDSIIIPAKSLESAFGLGRQLRIMTLFAANHYPDFENLKEVTVDQNIEPAQLSDKEKENLKFSNLLKHKIQKLDKNFNTYFEIKKEEQNKTYYIKTGK